MRKISTVNAVIVLSALIAACLLSPCLAAAATETITYDYYNTRELRKATYGAGGYAMQYVYDNSGNRTFDAVVAPLAMIVAQPSPLNLGTITVGDSSTASTITVTNLGAAPLQISTVTIGGTNATQFAKQSDACSGQTLQSLGACQIGIVFNPAAPATAKTASATINSNAANTPALSVTLNGTAQCLYAINPITSAMPYSGGSGTVAVASGPGCSWTATSNNTPWLSITAGASGAGNGTVGYSAAATSTSQQRVGTATIAGKSLSVTQYGAPCTTFSISSATAAYGPAGGSGSISVTTAVSGCAWNITSIPPWISPISPQSGTGNATVAFTVTQNTAATGRTATMTVAGQPFAIKQGGTLDVQKIGVFSNGAWYLDFNGNGVWDVGVDGTFSFGVATDVPVVGDWSGNGISKIGLFRNGSWYLDSNGNGVWDVGVDGTFSFGLATDVPVVGDWSGNGISKIGVFRNGSWYLDYNGNGAWDGCGAPPDPTKDACFVFGLSADIPVVADWNGDGKSKIGVFRSGNWYLDFNGNSIWDGTTSDRYFPAFGTSLPTARPVIGSW